MSGGFHLPQGNSDAGAGMAISRCSNSIVVPAMVMATDPARSVSALLSIPPAFKPGEYRLVR
jgi:hypothetical protein